MIDTTLNWRKLVLVCGISLTTNCTQQSGMDAAQLHIYIRGDMIVIDGTYHVMNRAATLSIKGLEGTYSIQNQPSLGIGILYRNK